MCITRRPSQSRAIQRVEVLDQILLCDLPSTRVNEESLQLPAMLVLEMISKYP